ncbi:MAG: undecaprenyl/decaprenyl-phosphate alpha-N-acetylglucosaminyl 1-phosphate transferase [Deltaproteobacteria bacterium]|nr:undecaprenyl/decaprenyl-phosphate alpha-N-acetylglucosaminyl 1-phosphate transferase [Deltaproteobacteria bacterium]
MLYLSIILLSAFITVSLIPVMTRLAARFQIVDFPDPRKVHTRPVPRIGGLAMALGASVPFILWTAADDFVRAYLVGAGALVIFGLLDDMKGLGYKAKFAGQVFAALVAVFYGGVRINSLGTLLPGAAPLPEWFAISLSIVAVVGVTNAINLADGLDGLAGGISLLGFCCIGYLAYLVGNNVVIILSLSLAGAIFGFLRYNTYPASLFMGDTGSQLLGFSAAVLAIKITQGDTPLSPVLPLIILGFPVLDTLSVMVERVREGRSPFSPDKNHFHHRLLRLGLSHAEAVLTIYVIQAMMIVSAILFKYYTDWVLMTSYTVFSALIISAVVVADRTGFQFKRYPLIDDVVKGRLRRIKDDNWIIRISFSISRMIIPLLFLFSCLLPANVPGYVSVIAVCFSLFILAVWMFVKNHMGFCLRFVLYLTIPLVLYLIEEGKAAWISAKLFAQYHFSFGIIAFFVLLTVKYSKRTKGFRMTTMDFLVIFIAVVVPNLPDQSIQSYHLGLLAVEIIVLLFGYEVLIKELRGRFDALTASTLIALLLIGIRGSTGF